MRASLLASFVAAALALAPTAPPPAVAAEDGAAALGPHDRVVFLGDSITQQRLWTRYVAQFVACRDPAAETRFFNAGWSGDTAKGGRARLLRDVFEVKPNVVFVFFGMNDGGYRATDPTVVADYSQHLAGIVTDLRAQNMRVVVMSPGCVDDEAAPRLKEAAYDDTLEALTKAAESVARKGGATFVDVHHPMREFLAQRRKAGLDDSLIPDGVHPNEQGHFVIAAALLGALRVEKAPPLGTWDAPSGRGKGLETVEKSRDVVVLRCTEPRPAPFFVPATEARTFVACGLADLAAPRLTVTGLAPGDWEVSYDDCAPSEFASTELARGVPVPGIDSARGKAVRDRVQQREENYFHLWRDVRLDMDGVPGVEAAVAGLMELDAGLARAARDAAAPAQDVLVRLTRLPDGENVAAGRTGEASDPNRFGWGAGGLTDGSWQGDPTHCYSTGGGEKFPKTVTVEFEKTARISMIRLGVPAFGSTKKVVVAVSADGRAWRDVGEVEFAQRRADRRTIGFEAIRAKHVRLTYVDHWPDTVAFPPTFCFTTELEVFTAK